MHKPQVCEANIESRLTDKSKAMCVPGYHRALRKYEYLIQNWSAFYDLEKWNNPAGEVVFIMNNTIQGARCCDHTCAFFAQEEMRKEGLKWVREEGEEEEERKMKKSYMGNVDNILLP